MLGRDREKHDPTFGAKNRRKASGEAVVIRNCPDAFGAIKPVSE